MNDDKYRFTADMAEISGLGGDYEECCTRSLQRAVKVNAPEASSGPIHARAWPETASCTCMKRALKSNVDSP